MRKIITLLVSLSLVLSLSACSNGKAKYNEGVEYLNQKDYENALACFEEAKNYQDAATKASECRDNIVSANLKDDKLAELTVISQNWSSDVKSGYLEEIYQKCANYLYTDFDLSEDGFKMIKMYRDLFEAFGDTASDQYSSLYNLINCEDIVEEWSACSVLLTTYHTAVVSILDTLNAYVTAGKISEIEKNIIPVLQNCITVFTTYFGTANARVNEYVSAIQSILDGITGELAHVDDDSYSTYYNKRIEGYDALDKLVTEYNRDVPGIVNVMIEEVNKAFSITD